MILQIIQDSNGAATGVFIPMDKWVLIKSSYPNVDKIDEDVTQQMIRAADELYDDYNPDKELTHFTQLDFENFYEAK